MPIIYNVTIEPTEIENHFHITWHSLGKDTRDSFTQEPEITPEEMQRLWQWPQCQLGIGQKLFRFLDGDARHFQQALNQAHHMGEPLQVNLWACKQTSDWPFELLAMEKTFLLSQQLHLVRCVSAWGKEKEALPGNRQLKLLFMACSALDVRPELDFEKEEEAIFHITRNLAIDMEVEDSGSLEGLRSRLEREVYDVVYLSGHAGIAKDGSPYFIMEDEFGNRLQVSPGELWNEALIENPPRLLFLSGCRTGETPETPDSAESTDAVSFAHLLVERYNVPAVLGWGRSVRDNQAIHAGKMLFHELSRGKTILEAVWRARYELIKEFPGENKPAWPLLRLFSSGMPLNSIVEKEQEWKPKVRVMTHVYLKNSLVKVLKEGFVGRRRQLQTGLRALKQGIDKVGLLLLGTGGLGKSCLAGKICERFLDHTLIIIHGRLNAISIESALKDAFVAAQDENGKHILAQKKKMAEIAFRHYGESRSAMMELNKNFHEYEENILSFLSEKIPSPTEDKKNNFIVVDTLAQLCASSFKEKNYLILLDDFEQNLEGVDKGEPGSLLPETEELLKALLHYLPFSGKMTQLVITSRYKFSLTEQNRDIVEERLEMVWLTSFQESEQRKKAMELPNILKYEDQAKIPDLLAAGHGNPRLMEWLDILVGQLKAVELPRLLEAIKDKQEDFVHEHVIRELINRGSKELELFLWRFSIYRRPVLLEGVALVVGKVGLRAWQELLQKGMGLSLVEHDQARQSYRVTPLLREELLKNLEDVKSCHKAAFNYYKKGCKNRQPIDPILTEEWVFHALGCGEEDVASREGKSLVSALRERLAFLESQRVGEWILKEKKQELSTEHDAFLLNELGGTISDLGDKQEAIKYYERALAINERIFGKEHHSVARDLNSMALAWDDLGETKKAIVYNEQSLAISKEIHGDTHTHVATSLNNLGLNWAALGDNRKAISYFEQALAIWTKVSGNNHLNVAYAVNNLGRSWEELGEFKKAIRYYEKALAIFNTVYGDQHPNVASTFNNLGMSWKALGNCRKALSYYEQALVIGKAVWGKNHPSIAKKMNNIGSVWYELGDFRKAIEYIEQVLAINQTVFGNKHPAVASDLTNLGETWRALGEPRKAIQFCEQALAIQKKIYEDKHPQIATTLNIMGMAWSSLGDKPKAISYYEQTLSIWQAVYGGTHHKVAIALNNLGGAWSALGNYRKAISYFEQALEIIESVFGKGHTNVAIQLNNLGDTWRVLGNPKRAIGYFDQALAIWMAIYGESHPNVATSLSNLGGAWFDLGEFDKSISCHERSLAINKHVFKNDHASVATELNNLGLAWFALGDYRKALSYYEQALTIDEQVFGNEHPNVSRDLNNLGEAWRELGQPKKAIDYYEQAMVILNVVYRDPHPDIASVLNNIGRTWSDLGDDRKAISYYEQTLAIDNHVFGKEHPAVARDLISLGAAYFSLGNNRKAKPYFQNAYDIYKKFFGELHPRTQNAKDWLDDC